LTNAFTIVDKGRGRKGRGGEEEKKCAWQRQVRSLVTVPGR